MYYDIICINFKIFKFIIYTYIYYIFIYIIYTYLLKIFIFCKKIDFAINILSVSIIQFILYFIIYLYTIFF